MSASRWRHEADDGVFETGVDVLNDLTNWLVDEALTQY